MITDSRLDKRTLSDWHEIKAAEAQHQREMPRRIMNMLIELERLGTCMPINQLQHSLQTATRAERSGACEEMVVAALCHDIGKAISFDNHAAISAEIIKPYVSRDTYEIVRTHADFQRKNHRAFLELNAGLKKKADAARRKHARRAWFAAACQFADEWDLPASDPDYDTFVLEHFLPALENVFRAPKPQPLSVRARIRLLLRKILLRPSN